MPDGRPRLSELERRGEFIGRHIGPSPNEIADMLETLGMKSLDELVERVVPAAIRTAPQDGPEPLTESEALARLGDHAGQNRVLRSMIGMGYHDCFTPP